HGQHDEEGDRQGHDEQPDVAVHRGEWDAGDAGYHEQQLAIRRRDHADHEVDDRRDAEMHGIDADGADGGHGDRHHHQQHEQRIEEAAEHQKQQVDDEEEFEARDVERRDPGADLDADLLAGDDIVDEERAGDDEGHD